MSYNHDDVLERAGPEVIEFHKKIYRMIGLYEFLLCPHKMYWTVEHESFVYPVEQQIFAALKEAYGFEKLVVGGRHFP